MCHFCGTHFNPPPTQWQNSLTGTFCWKVASLNKPKVLFTPRCYKWLQFFRSWNSLQGSLWQEMMFYGARRGSSCGIRALLLALAYRPILSRLANFFPLRPSALTAINYHTALFPSLKQNYVYQYRSIYINFMFCTIFVRRIPIFVSLELTWSNLGCKHSKYILRWQFIERFSLCFHFPSTYF